jgi:signal transduction histidine kinase
LRELALHLLDVIENAIRAESAIIRVTIQLDRDEEYLTLRVEDDGPGLPVTPGQALDPFFTTKAGKRTGLGLSLFQASAQQAGGSLRVLDSELGGVAIEARFQYHHVDRIPLGDVAGTLMTSAMSAPEIVWICQIEGPAGESTLILQDYIEETQDTSLYQGVMAFTQAIRKGIEDAGIEA